MLRTPASHLTPPPSAGGRRGLPRFSADPAENKGMRKNETILSLVLLLGAPMAVPTPARAQVDVRIQIPLPTIRFEVQPRLVAVSEGVQVVPDYPEEVFYQDG